MFHKISIKKQIYSYEEFHFCKLCPRILLTKSGFDDHMKLIHKLQGEEKILEKSTDISESCSSKHFCKICDRLVVSGDHVKEFHGQDGDLKCPKCDKIFDNYRAVMDHFVNMHEKNPCSFCGEMISDKRMKHHILLKHKPYSDREFKCEVCGKRFIRKEELKVHMNSHTGEKPFLCKFCGTGFKGSGARSNHEKLVHMNKSV